MMTLYLIRHAVDDAIFLGREGIRSVPLLFSQPEHAKELIAGVAKENRFFVVSDWCVEPVNLAFIDRGESKGGAA